MSSLRPSSGSHSLLSSKPHHGLAASPVRWAVLLIAKAIFTPLASAAPLAILQRTAADDEPSADDPNLYLYLSISVVLVLLGGVFAGLTIAFMGQDETYLQVIATSGEGSEKRHAKRVLRLLGKGKHWVLVTLLLGNVITNETLPVVLDRSLGGGWPAVLSSTVLIVIFGEIAPQSICVRYGLSIGAYMTPLVHILMWILGPVAWPTAKLLDWLLGEDHGTMYKKAGLKTLVQLHKTLGIAPGERLSEDEVTIINSVLDLKEKPVGDIMTPMDDVFIMSADTVLDERMMDIILSQGYSRIPIYAPDNQRNFLGMLLVKILITYDPEDAKRVRDFALATLPETAPFTSCLDIINFFQEGKSHMVLVSDSPGQPHGALGVVTLEDVIEELIGEEIVDESDVFVDVHKAIRRMAPAPYQRFNKRPSLDPIVQAEDDPDNDADENEPLLSTSGRERSSSQPQGMNGSASPRFGGRRKDSTASEGRRDSPRRGLVSGRSSTLEMREHLKHLGPSNAASKPRETKFKSVKIKPGIKTIPEGVATTKGSDGDNRKRKGRSSSADQPTNVGRQTSTTDGTEADVLLKSAGRDASDGAAAIRAGYGTLNSSTEIPRIRGTSTESEKRKNLISAGEASKLAEAKAESPPKAKQSKTGEWLKVPGKVVVGESGEELDSVGDMQAPSRDRSRSHRGVRSGSITELEVEVGGLKKVVLETTSSSSDVEEEGEMKSANLILSAAAHVDDGKDGTASDDTETQSKNGNKSRKKRGKKKKKHH